jgi:hypothetical protein
MLSLLLLSLLHKALHHIIWCQAMRNCYTSSSNDNQYPFPSMFIAARDGGCSCTRIGWHDYLLFIIIIIIIIVVMLRCIQQSVSRSAVVG